MGVSESSIRLLQPKRQLGQLHSNSPAKTDFKVLNKTMRNYQKVEQKFINKFLKDCDTVSLKINRYISGVLPAIEKNDDSKSSESNTTEELESTGKKKKHSIFKH